ncbi:helix-turn-helix domain-containing protein [Lactiplantibacillus argentoratensis]
MGFHRILNLDVTTDLLMKICTGLDCNLNDICETVPINEE